MGKFSFINGTIQGLGKIKLKEDGKLHCSVSVKEDGAFYTISSTHANLCYVIMNLKKNDTCIGGGNLKEKN